MRAAWLPSSFVRLLLEDPATPSSCAFSPTGSMAGGARSFKQLNEFVFASSSEQHGIDAALLDTPDMPFGDYHFENCLDANWMPVRKPVAL